MIGLVVNGSWNAASNRAIIGHAANGVKSFHKVAQSQGEEKSLPLVRLEVLFHKIHLLGKGHTKKLVKN